MPSQSLQQLVSALEPADGTSARPLEHERRRALRVEVPFPATVHGVDADGQRFKAAAVLGNLSATHLYLRLPRNVERATRLFVAVRLSVEPVEQASAPSVAVLGPVLRVDRRPDGMYGVVIEFARHRFLYATP